VQVEYSSVLVDRKQFVHSRWGNVLQVYCLRISPRASLLLVGTRHAVSAYRLSPHCVARFVAQWPLCDPHNSEAQWIGARVCVTDSGALRVYIGAQIERVVYVIVLQTGEHCHAIKLITTNYSGLSSSGIIRIKGSPVSGGTFMMCPRLTQTTGSACMIWNCKTCDYVVTYCAEKRRRVVCMLDGPCESVIAHDQSSGFALLTALNSLYHISSAGVVLACCSFPGVTVIGMAPTERGVLVLYLMSGK
jgi:hypothetical protein